MCWSTQVSLNTFALAIFGMILAKANKYSFMSDSPWTIWIYLSLISFACMQLLEAFIWLDLNHTVSKWNYILSILGIIIILSQPCFTILCIHTKNEWWSNMKLHMFIAYIIFIIISILYLFIIQYPINFKSIRASNGHLEWLWLNPFLGKLWLFGLFWTFFLLLPFVVNRSFSGIVVLFTFIISLFTFWKSGTAGSMWCWILNGIWFFIIADIFRKVMCI